MKSNGFLLTEDMLWDYADGLLSDAEVAQVKAYIAQHPEYQSQLDNVLANREALMQIPMDSPRAGFADKVMAAWVGEQVHVKAERTTDKRMLLFPLLLGGLLLAALLYIIFMAVSSAAPATQPVNLLENLPKISPDDMAKVFLNPTTQTLLFGGFCLAFLGLLDKYLGLRFQKN